MHVGFIGTGSMGSILIEGFITSKGLLPAQIHASNRSFDKAKELAKTYTGLHAYPSNVRVVQKADVVFLCVKPLEFKKVIDEISPHVREEQLILSITSPVPITDLEHHLRGKIAKVIPSITNVAAHGGSLLISGKRLTTRDKNFIYQLMKSISEPVWIKEEHTRASSDIVSCGPAFISYLLQEMIEAAQRETGLPQQQATDLVSHMMVGFGQLFAQERFTLATLQERVCVPGGVTGEGLKVLEAEVKDMFDQLFQQTHRKYDRDLDHVHDMFYGHT